MIARALVAIAAGATAIVSPGLRPGSDQAATPQTPVFRGGVELVTVDVTVLDTRGRPVPGLQPRDFTIEAGGKPRAIESLEYLTSAVPPKARMLTPLPDGRVPAAPETPVAPPPAAEGRHMLFVADVDRIRAGEGRPAFRKIAEYLDRIAPRDRVGLVALPTGTPSVELTEDRGVVRTALERVAGTSVHRSSCDPTPAEVTADLARDSRGKGAFCERTRGMPCPSCGTVPFALFASLYRQQSLAVLESIGELMRAMAPLRGRKAIVLISEGLFLDNETVDDVRALGQTSDRTRVVLYGMHLDAPPIEAAAKTFTTLAGQIEDRYGFDGMADVAYAGGGAAVRVIGFADGPLSRIDVELSGYYVLSFRREPGDRSGRATSIRVRVNQSGLDIRARPSFTPK